jgi:hypothetical protein
MKRLLIIFCLLFISVSPVLADTMVVQAKTTISTDYPNEDVVVEVVRDCTLENIVLKTGYILEGKMIVTDPKRLKRDATFTFYPLCYKDLEGNIHRFTTLYYGKFSPKFELDIKGLAQTAAFGVADHFFKGISMGFYAVQGAVQNKDGNRVTSTVSNVYEHSILSYISKGGAVELPKESIFGLKFKECKNSPLPNE